MFRRWKFNIFLLQKFWEGRHIYYLDETWVSAGDFMSKSWVDTTVTSHRDKFLKVVRIFPVKENDSLC